MPTKKDKAVTDSAGAGYDVGIASTEPADATLGQTDLSSGVPTKPIAFGARNRAKRMYKFVAGKRKVQYVDYASIAAAETAGWRLASEYPSRTISSTSTRTKPVITKLATGLYYGWNMPIATYNKLGAAGRTALKIEDYTAAKADDTAFGANSFILPVPFEGIPAGTKFGRKALRVRYEIADAGGGQPQFVSTYSGVE
jgi:hypothetical protein